VPHGCADDEDVCALVVKGLAQRDFFVAGVGVLLSVKQFKKGQFLVRMVDQVGLNSLY
jgi:hypothetical protein